MSAKEFLNDYAIDDFHVYGRHEEQYMLDSLMVEYAKEYHEREVKRLGLINVNDCNSYFERLENGRKYIMSIQPNEYDSGDALEAFGFTRNGIL